MLIEGRGTRNLDPLVFFVATDSRLRGTIRSVKATTLTVIASLLALNLTTLSNSEPQHRNDKRPALRSASTVKANVPIGFESNVGQFSSEARYVSRGRGYDLFLTPAEAVFNFKTPHAASDPACVSASVKSAAVPSPRGKRNPLCYSISSEPIRLRIAGGNAQPSPKADSLSLRTAITCWATTRASGTSTFRTLEKSGTPAFIPVSIWSTTGRTANWNMTSW